MFSRLRDDGGANFGLLGGEEGPPSCRRMHAPGRGRGDTERKVLAKIDWQDEEAFVRVGFIETNSELSSGKVVTV